MSKKCLSMVTSVVTGLSMIFGTVYGAFAAEEEPFEIVSLRSEYEKHFDNGDGTITAFVNTVPIHYLENGEWHEIDNTLVMDESGDYVNRSNPMNVTLSSGASAKAITAAGTDQMVKIERDGYMISWDMLNLRTNIADQISTTQMNPVSVLTISDDDDENNIDLGGMRLNEMADACVDKLDSGVIYPSVYNGVDIDIDIMPTAVKETIILNSAESAPEQFAYYIMTDGLAAELQADNSIIFINDSGEVIFTIPAMYMFDSSDKAENNYDIETSIEPFKAGYLLTITPDSEWLASEERVYPVMIDPEVEYEDSVNITDSYIDESDPNRNFTNQYLKMGGSSSDGTRTETFIRYQSDFTNFHYSTEILEAKLVLYFLENNQSGSNPTIKVSLMTEEPGQPTWNTAGDEEASSLSLTSFVVTENTYGDNEINITKAVSLWLNYAHTNQIVGSANYGFMLAPVNADIIDYRTLTAYSSRYQALAPYFSITYSSYLDRSAYAMNYLPYKYNATHARGGITNFQNRMNCYAYALQMYYKGELADGEYYKLQPGEIGLPQQNDSINTYGLLMDGYESCSTVSEFYSFTESQMIRDFAQMNMKISRVPIDEHFALPSDFNENNERIIAMIVGQKTAGGFDAHFLLRHGNGTCSKEGHSESCSVWSHKPGQSKITQEAWGSNIYGVILCDSNIISDTKTLSGFTYNSCTYRDDPWFYSIDKDTYVYNSWYYYGHYDESTGTQFVQLKEE